MFVANGFFALPNSPGLDAFSDRHFRAFELAARKPWFLVTLPVHDHKSWAPLSVCCAWQSDVLGLITSRADRVVLALQAVIPKEDAQWGWTIRDISKVWHAVDHLGNGVMVYEDSSGAQFCGTDSTPPPEGLSEVELLFEAQRGSECC